MTADYFAVFDLPRSFDINLADLEKRYFAVQRQSHPDRLIGKGAADRQSAIARSMLANEAHEALKNPLKRAQHLLSLHGIAHDSVKPSQELLIKIMELREALAEANTKADIEQISHDNEAEVAATLNALLQAFGNSDIPEAAQLAMRLSYLMKMEDEIRLRLKIIAG